MKLYNTLISVTHIVNLFYKYLIAQFNINYNFLITCYNYWPHKCVDKLRV